ncbi:Thiol-disulfide oxidoreductase ResA [Jeotgalicoccus saudimassiliensis]|uniref:Thiol-disulfide oxidoreductase ResA n=1 Tax=Jeotgalicoccus saudimassiliensis TaxID=1461582 RepID=A0A078M4C7_9STAP|nr:redoxin domain-containing protein [Jeotgalicoccus saudimassiliensis]CEA00147.1 Thiol-disulfide oxidoreductase ResA [Jeotgalicoccus saudimassiliensis]
MKKGTRKIIRTGTIITIAALLGITLYLNLRDGSQTVNVGDEAVDFKLETLDGEEIQLSEITKDKGVIVNFWGTWCKPCREEMPEMNQVYNEGHEDYEIIAVNVSENKQQIEQFISGLSEDLDYPIALDPNRSVTKAYNIGPLPTTIAINKDGVVVKKQEYQLTKEDIYTFIDESLE